MQLFKTLMGMLFFLSVVGIPLMIREQSQGASYENPLDKAKFITELGSGLVLVSTIGFVKFPYLGWGTLVLGAVLTISGFRGLYKYGRDEVYLPWASVVVGTCLTFFASIAWPAITWQQPYLTLTCALIGMLMFIPAAFKLFELKRNIKDNSELRDAKFNFVAGVTFSTMLFVVFIDVPYAAWIPLVFSITLAVSGFKKVLTYGPNLGYVARSSVVIGAIIIFLSTLMLLYKSWIHPSVGCAMFALGSTLFMNGMIKKKYVKKGS